MSVDIFVGYLTIMKYPSEVTDPWYSMRVSGGLVTGILDSSGTSVPIGDFDKIVFRGEALNGIVVEIASGLLMRNGERVYVMIDDDHVEHLMATESSSKSVSFTFVKGLTRVGRD